MTFRLLDDRRHAVIDCWAQRHDNTWALTAIVPGTKVHFDRSAIIDAVDKHGSSFPYLRIWPAGLSLHGEIVDDGGVTHEVAHTRWCIAEVECAGGTVLVSVKANMLHRP